MHQKKRKLFVLYSIPIWFRKKNSKLNLCKEKLYLVSYSIPLSCMVVLLLTGIFAINPSLALKTSAVTIQDEWVVKENNSNSGSSASVENDNSDSNISETSNDVNTDPVDDSFGGFGGDEVELSQEDVDAGISLQSVAPTPTLAITVSNTGQEINAAQGGNTVYGSYIIGMTGSNVKDYTLSIKANSTNLTMPSGASSSTSTVSGANGKTGDSMAANTWGYKLTETSTSESSYSTLNYASLPTSLTQIASGTVSSPYNLSTSKQLVFAAKFGDSATLGKYTGSITLSFSATPAQTGQLWSNGIASSIMDMQDIKTGFCENNSKIAEGDTITLKDSRDSNSYTIVKLRDGKCWMQQNLRLGDTSTMLLKPSDTNIASNYILPAGTKSGSWNISDYTVQQIRLDDTDWNNYYSWCAATAGTCSESIADNVNVSSSICPKGWHLPSNGSENATGTDVGKNSEFYKLTDGLSDYDIISSPYLFGTYGYINSANGSPDLAGVGGGGYWSRTSTSSSNAYALIFWDSHFRPTSNRARYAGCSVRCVANY